MRSTELHTIAGTRLSPNSPPHLLTFSAQTRNPQRTLFLPLSPPSFQSITPQSLHQSKRIRITYCFTESGDLPFNSSTTSSDHNNLNLDPQKNQPATGLDCNLSTPRARVLQNAVWIGVATATSKILGLLREIILAAVFGVGPVATAFKYASVLPSFSASLLGGVNGPIHITMATTLRLCILTVPQGLPL